MTLSGLKIPLVEVKPIVKTEKSISIMKWYVIQTKPQQEFRALENLQNQGFEVYLPIHGVEKLRRSQIQVKQEPLFSRYLFIRLDQILSNWGVIRSTRGVSQLLRFGIESQPSVVDDQIILFLKTKLDDQNLTKTLFTDQELVQVKMGPFTGLEGFYQKLIQTSSGETRALLLIEVLGKLQRIAIPLTNL